VKLWEFVEDGQLPGIIGPIDDGVKVNVPCANAVAVQKSAMGRQGFSFMRLFFLTESLRDGVAT
jgi:hypothetical protein